jgi:hypothetical protein
MSDVEKTPAQSLEVISDGCPSAIELAALAEIPRSTYLGWGATPLDTFSVEGLFGLQRRVHDVLLKRRVLHVPPEIEATIPSETRKYVEFNFTSRFWGRVHANSENHQRRLQKDFSGLDDTQKEIFNRALRGAANPAELLYVQSMLHIPSIELGCITHPYGTHTDKLEEMREAARLSMELFGADVRPEAELQDVFAIKQTDQVTNVVDRPPLIDARGYPRKAFSGEQANMHLRDAVVVTRKRDHGVLPDGKVVRERTSFVFRPALLDPRLAEAMQKVDLAYNDRALQQLNEIAQSMELDGVFADLIKEKMFDIIIPLSTTIYSFDRKIIAEIKRQEARQKLARSAWNAELRQRIGEMDDELSPETTRTIANSFSWDLNDSDF